MTKIENIAKSINYELKDIEILKNTRKRDNDEDVNMAELKELEEGFKRTDDI